MKFYDTDGNLVWVSATTNVPYNLFSGDSGMLFLMTGKEKSYVKDFGNCDTFYGVPVGTNQDFTLQNGSIVRVIRSGVTPPAIVLNLFTQWMEGYPYNGLFTINSQEIPAGSGNYYLTQNAFWQPDGAGATIMGIIVRIFNPDLSIYYYRLDWKRVNSWTPEQIQVHMDFFMGVDASDDDVSTTGGGDGAYDQTSTTDIGWPTLPSVSFLDSHMVHGYAMTTAQTNDLSTWFWGDTVWDRIKQLWADPMQGILSFGILPIDAPHSSTAKYVNIGLAVSDSAEGYPITSEWVIKDFGKFFLPETWGSFIDYTSTSISVYLPYIGVKDLDIQECMNSELHLKYYINCLTGDCVAIIKVAKSTGDKNIAAVNSVLYQFTGNILIQCPLTGADFSQRISAAINQFIATATTAGAGMITGTAAGAMSAAQAGVSGPASMITSMKAPVKRDGVLGSVSGYMSVQYPYIILDRPVQNIPADFNQYKGRASMVTTPLNQMRGYTEIEYCILDSLTCTDAEKDEIDSLLKSGVIV